IRTLRFMLGPVAAPGFAASTDPGSSQLRLGAKSGRDGAGGRKPISKAQIVRSGRGGSVCEGRSYSCVGRVERARSRQRWKLSQRGRSEEHTSELQSRF